VKVGRRGRVVITGDILYSMMYVLMNILRQKYFFNDCFVVDIPLTSKQDHDRPQKLKTV
jgi:hypothetical protein